MVACLDECTVNLRPYLRHGWGPKGQRIVAKTNYSRERFHIIGAKTHKTFVFSFIERQTQRTFMRFIKKLSQRFPKLVVITDNATWHRGIKVQNMLRKKKKTLRLLYFPPYSPELNPVEQHWKLLKSRLGNKCLRTISTTKYHTNKILRRKELMPKMFQYLCN